MLSDELKGVKVKVDHAPYKRQYRVVKVTHESAEELKFELKDHGETTVAKYFRQRYPRFMKFPQLPCIQSGTSQRKVYLPLEACSIVGKQPCRKKLSESLTAKMISHTAHAPAKRFESIATSVNKVVEYSEPYLRKFSITVDTNPTKLTGRVLNPPLLLFNGKNKHPKDGTWNIAGVRLFTTKPVQKWALLRVNCDLGDVESTLIEDLRHTADNIGRLYKQLRVLKAEQVELVIVVLGDEAPYADIKEAAEVQVGIRTQCIRMQNVVDNWSRPLIINLCLKINAKLGGTNNALASAQMPQLLKQFAMIIGADVTHPAPGDSVRPSIAACVASVDKVPSQYRAAIRVQIQQQEAVARVEIIEDLKVSAVHICSQSQRCDIAQNEKRQCSSMSF
ncbi:hypothetical protein V5799_002821 [Amblyomma americanum]|uniref:Uncharacterized protein n=1 Tax=Amblyomma americanum TaxID=6943 RepID=A0AAQ4DAQ2_AMBAM